MDESYRPAVTSFKPAEQSGNKIREARRIGDGYYKGTYGNRSTGFRSRRTFLSTSLDLNPEGTQLSQEVARKLIDPTKVGVSL